METKQTLVTLALMATAYSLGFAWKFKKRDGLIKAQENQIAHLKAVMFLALDRLKKGLQNETGNNMAMLKANDNVIDLLTEVLHAMNKPGADQTPDI